MRTGVSTSSTIGNDSVHTGARARRFLSEEFLVSTFVSTLASLPGYTKRYVLREFESANGVADVIAFDSDVDKEHVLALAAVSARWAYALYRLPVGECFSLDDFSAFAGVSSQRARAVLKEFVVAGFCEQVQSKWVKRIELKPISTHIHAIEGKLRDWKRALWQAYRYLDYATRSWVVLDHAAIRPARENLAEFKRLNVGLACVSPTGEVEVVYDSCLPDPRDDLRFWHANAAIARRLYHDFRYFV